MSNLQQWEPPKELMVLRDQINKFFDDIFSLHQGIKNISGLIGSITDSNLADDKQQIIVKLDLPDINPNSIKVNIEGGRLVVSGDKKQITKRISPAFFYQAQTYGAFKKILPLSSSVKAEGAKASFKNGVLEVRLPKSANIKNKSFTIPLV